MKDFFEKVKDLLYDSVDYIIMIAIIGIVVLVIGWRLDLLFAKDASNMIDSNVLVENNEPEKPKNPTNNEDDLDRDNIEDEENNMDMVEDTEDIEEPVVGTQPENKPDDSSIVKVNIPSGSLPGKIGIILEEKGLIASKDDFVEKSQELKLDTKLRSGDFEIKEGSSVEEILKIIAR